MLALCIASHHSGLIDCISADSGKYGVDMFTRRMNKAGEKTHLEEVIRAAILARTEELQPFRELTVKSVRKPDAANRHVRFDERGWETGRLRSVSAPVLDSTPLLENTLYVCREASLLRAGELSLPTKQFYTNLFYL
jgi:hypothetical protein